MIGWIVALTIFVGWLITVFKAGSAIIVLKNVIKTLANLALDAENARKLKEDLDIK